jgi:rfaE bifunctional protein nucleotidyltransferase chain/domain
VPGPTTPEAKIARLADLLPRIEARRRLGQRIVFTNGVFDLLHVGHVRYLTRARSLGDLLVVGLNSDSSVRGNKAEGRPIVPQEERSEVVAALSAVDFVVIFDEPTATQLVEQIRPDVYVKGGDYTIEALPEAEAVIGYGGVVEVAPLEPGHSTSSLVEEIVRRFGSARSSG